jgi:hypothetical protein
VQEEKLREDHPDRLASQNELANAYWEGGQTEKALKIQEHVVTVARRVFRADHPTRITVEANLSTLLNETRKKCIQNKVLPVRTQASPPRRPRSPEREEEGMYPEQGSTSPDTSESATKTKVTRKRRITLALRSLKRW